MKTLLLLPALFILISNTGVNKNQDKSSAGLYSTAEDFLQHKLTYSIDCNSKDKLKINDFFGSPTGYVVYNGEKHAFDKNKTYGYHSCDNKNYRFYNHSVYQIIDTGGFYMYYQYRSEEQTKGKGLVKKDAYFFSKKSDGDIELLTINNLEKAFPENSSFHYAIEASCKTDKDLLAYDSFQNIYKIKYLYNQSAK
jgi:hypothetical protein